jgi:hypothetical protein
MKSLARNFAISILLFWSLLLPLNALAQAPIVSNVAPGVGIAGTQVTFTGTGFGAAQSGNVWLGSTYGAVVSWSDTQVVATIVSGAKSGTAQILQNGAWSSAISFTVITPSVTSVTPSTGMAGTQVTFTGTGFGATQGSGNVWLGSTYGAVVSWSDTQIVATVAAGSQSGTAQILQGGVWSDVISFTVTTPKVTSVTPTSAMAGVQVAFTGTGFGVTQGSGNVWLGSTYGTVVSWSDTQVVATVAAGSKSGTAQILQGGVWSDVINFTVTTPKVIGVTPTSATAGTQVTFVGTGFGSTQGSGNVWLGSTYGIVVSWSNTQVVAMVAAGSKSGTAQILQGGVWSDVINFTVTTPKVTSVTPTSAMAGTQVTFTGTGFGATQGSGNVWLGSTYGTVVSWSDTQVVATVAAGSKSGTAQVLQGGVWSDVIDFAVITPKVTSVTPASGMSGTQVTFTGTGFGATQGSGNIWLGSTYGAVVSWSDTKIVATVASGAKSGTAQVLQGGVWSDVINFTVVTPSVTAVSPGTGIAGTQVTFTGTGFGATQGSGNVWLGSTYGTVVSWSDTRVVATVASGAKSGAAQILQGGVWSDVIAFTVVTPIVTNVSPARGLPGTQITITGTGFGATQGSGNVWLGSTYGIVMSWSDTQVVATVATGAQSGTAQILQGGVWSDPVNFTINSSGPLLQFSVADTPLQVNLTSPQTLDWIHWGRISATTPDRKAGNAPLISDYIASNTQPQTGTGTVKFSWTDGNHPPVVSEANEAVQTFDANGGFQITAPADTTVKTLNLYTQVFFGQAQLQASLSDGSATAITDQSVTDTNVGSKIYSIDFRAASAGQTLTVTVSAVSGGVGLQAATLTPHLPTVAVTSPAAGLSFGAQDTVPLSATATQFDNLITDVSLNSGGVFFEAPNPPYNASLVPGTTGHYSVVATATDSAGLVSASAPVEFDVIGQGGTLSIDEVAPLSPIDLNAQGTGDWVLWGPLNTGDFIINNPGNIMARKSGVAPLISDYTPIGNHPITSTTLAHPLCFLGDQQNYCSGSQLVVHGLNDGYQITVAADTTPRTLQLYVGVRFGDGKLTAFLSDGSAAVATEVGGGGPPPPPANHTTLYTINYSAASSGQTLTVRFTLNSDQGGGELDLIGAALSGPSATPVAPAPQIAFIDPKAGETNIKVTLIGTNFGTTQGDGQVLFGQVSAQVATWSDTSISVIVPATISQGSTVGVTVLNDNGTSNRVNFTVPTYKIFPASLKMLVGQSQSLQATDPNGNPIVGLQWTASDLTVVNLSTDDPPVVTAVGAGTARVYAGDLPVPVTVYATAPPLVSISIAPQNAQVALGLTQQLAATGTYADGSTQNLTATSTWNSTSPSVATVSSTGVASGVQVGTATILVSVGFVSGSTTLTVQPSLLKSLTVTPAIAGTTVGGTVQFTATGVYTDNSTQDLTASVTWSSRNAGVATIGSNGLATGTGTGRILITASQGAITNSAPLTVTTSSAPPGITTFVSPSPNAGGWTNSNTTVTFICAAGSATVVTCPGPQTVSTEGTGQIVSGTVVDATGSSASASVTINLDKTKPALAITSPADGTVFSSAALTVTGTASDALSGLNFVTCNGATANLSSADFSCDVSLHPGVNLLMVRATDLAGNVSASIMHVTLNTPLPAPLSLEITPRNANMLVGATQQFTAVDELGRPRTDATWTISDSSLVTITTDSPPILTAVAVGQLTLTANVGSASAQVPVRILPGESLPVGTTRWSLPSSDGFTATSVVRAQRVDGAPDLYAIETNSSGAAHIRALTEDGRQLWSAQFPNSTGGQVTVAAAGDNYGGLIINLGFPTAFPAGNEEYIDLDPQTGTQLWSYSATGISGTNAVGTDGTIYVWQEADALATGINPVTQTPPMAHLVAIDGLTGNPLARYPIPIGTQVTDDGRFSGATNPVVAGPVIDANGTVWAAFEADQFYGASGVITDTLSVLKVTPDGASSTFALHTFTGDFSTSGILSGPLSVIPNGQGGVLVSVEADTYTNFVQLIDRAYHVSNVSSGGSSTNFTFPSAMANMVLGENGVAYADSAGNEVAFDTSSGKSLWTYQTGNSHLIGATSDGGLIVNQSGLGLVTLDSSGNVATSLGTSVPVAVPARAAQNWLGIFNNNSFGEFPGPTTSFSTNDFSFLFGGPQSQNRADLDDQCLKDDELKDNFLANGIVAASTPDANGIVTVTYGADNGHGRSTGGVPSPDFTEGFNLWNQYSSTTGVMFVQAAAGIKPDLSLQEGEGNECIEGGTTGGVIIYDATWLSRQKSTDPKVTQSSKIGVAHEIGHLFGLDDQLSDRNPAGIMNKAVGRLCSTATSNATNVTPADAKAAAGCQKKAQKLHGK